MTTSHTFRTIAVALREHITDTYALLAATDDVERALSGQPPLMEYTHVALVERALNEWQCVAFVRNGQKIHAIKHLRQVTGCGLLAAKNAVTDGRMTAKVQFL